MTIRTDYSAGDPYEAADHNEENTAILDNQARVAWFKKTLEAAENIDGTTTPQLVSHYLSNVAEDLDQDSSDTNDVNSGIRFANNLLQSFIAPDGDRITLTDVEIYAALAVSSRTVRLEIFELDSNHDPVGSAVYESAYISNSIWASGPVWAGWTGLSVSLTAGQRYGIKVSGSHSGDCIYWHYQNSNVYADGKLRRSTDSGVSFSDLNSGNADGSFRMNITVEATDASKIEKADGSDVLKTRVLGFVSDNVISGNDGVVQTHGIIEGFSGLTRGVIYYLSDTPGAISSSPGTIEVPVGIGFSETELQLIEIKATYVENAFGVDTFNPTALNETKVITHGLGRIPKRIRIKWFDTNPIADGNGNAGEGIYDGTNYATLYHYKSGNPGITVATSEAKILIVDNETSGNTNWQAIISAMDENTFTIQADVFSQSENISFLWEAL